jgi:hypothetical protein
VRKRAESLAPLCSLKIESLGLQASEINLERSLPCSGWSRWNLTPIPPYVDHIDSAMLERETVLEWILIDRKKICFGVIGLSQYIKAPSGLTSLVSPLNVSSEVLMVTGQLTVLLGCWRFSLDMECLAAQTFRRAIVEM